ncbi:MAG: MATE family efflux transporter [Cytophagales bacterium]|nr:MATE family efflux transporter [Cytophagales bacterium]
MDSKLLKGNILSGILKLALPIMGTSFIQMAYNLTDMKWLGEVGSQTVAAVGTASFFIWLGNSLLMATKIGAEVGVSQSVGKRDQKGVNSFAQQSIKLALLFSLVFAGLVLLLAPFLIGIYGLEPASQEIGVNYLRIVALGMVFSYANPTLAGILTGQGNSKMPFYFNTFGLLLNITLDPLFIFGGGFIPAMGANGAAIATVLSQTVVFICFILYLKKKDSFSFSLFSRLESAFVKPIINVGGPVALQMSLFSAFAMVLARIVAQWGELPLAVQSVGMQVEAISWMTAGGFATALGTFTGQNYGAGLFKRLKKGVWVTYAVASLVGVFSTLLFALFGHEIYGFFLPEPEAVELGSVYLKILAVSQLFMIWEITASGLFNGVSKSHIPSYIGIIFTALRIPMALVLGMYLGFGVEGVWWAVTISSILKGTIMLLWSTKLLYQLKQRLAKIRGKSNTKITDREIREELAEAGCC